MKQLRIRNNPIHDKINIGLMTGHLPDTDTDTETTMTNSSSEPMLEINMATATRLNNPNTQYLTDDIISKISHLDPQSLATVQAFLTQSFALSSLQNLLPQQQYSGTTTNISPFLPVGIISDINNQTTDIEHENKPDIPNNSNLEQVFEVPDSMIGYIFNENTNDLVKVKLVETTDGLQTYQPYEQGQQTQLAPCKTISAPSHDIKLENASREPPKNTSTQPMTNDMPIKRPVKKECKFRKVTANWKMLRNRSLHSKFVKTFQNNTIQYATKQRSAPKHKLVSNRTTNQDKKDFTTGKGKGKPISESGLIQY